MVRLVNCSLVPIGRDLLLAFVVGHSVGVQRNVHPTSITLGELEPTVCASSFKLHYG